MPRSMRDSDEETDVKFGRKTRALAGSAVVDSPLRRSSRIKPATKHYESSPDSSLSDGSNVSNTQLTRVTRRRAGTMDNSAAAEKNRNLRSRRNSVASDVSEPTDVDNLATPTKKTRAVAARDILNKPNSRTSKRSTRAGSEAKSPPATSRVTRRMRASSMEPEVNVEVIETPPVKSKRRASVLPSEATVEEEKEVMKIVVITLDRALPNVKESSESGLDNSFNSARSNKSLSGSKDKLSRSIVDVDEKSKEDNICVKEAHNNAADKPPSDTPEGVKADVPVDNEKAISECDETVVGESESFSADAVTITESPVNTADQVLSQNANEDTSKDLVVKNENIIFISIDEHDEDVSNKENHTANIISDTQNKEDIISNTLLQSPKPLSASNINTNKLTKEVCKSPSIEASLSAKRRCSKELPDATNDTALPAKEVSTNADLANSAANRNTSVNDEDGDSSDNMQKLVVSTDTDSLNEVPLNESSDKNALPVEICSNSSLEDSIQIAECGDSVNKADNSTSIEANKSLEKPVEKTYPDDECNQDTTIAMDISTSLVEDTANKNEESEEDGVNQIMSTDDKSEAKEEAGKLNESANLMEFDEVECTQENHSKPSDVSLLANTESIASQDETETTALDLQEKGDANNSPILGDTMPKSSQDARTSPENSTSTNKNEDVTDMVKITESSAVTETPAEATEEVPEKGELSKKTSLSDDPPTPRKSVDKVQSNNEEKSEGKAETSKKNQEIMEVDDNDSDTNTANLFQDIPAEEWKGKSVDADKDSVHSMSTERLENESENDCDLILVDREAWLAAENIKLNKENEPFDYDSDDTIVLKSRRDSLKATGEGKAVLDVVSEDECKMNVSKRKSLNTSSKRRSIKQAEAGDREDVKDDPEDTGLSAEEAKDTGCKLNRKSISKETDEQQSTPKCNVSLQKPAEEKSLSESQQATETKDTSDKSFTNSPLNKSKSDDTSKRRKSLNKSAEEMDDKAEISSETEFEKKRKSLNKSKSNESDLAETESSNENVIIRKKKSKSSNSSSKKRVKTRQLDANLIDSKESEVTEKTRSSKKIIHSNLESDSDGSRDNIDFQDSEEKILPKFFFDGESNSDSDNENESDNSIDSDIRREYNLDGEEITEFADDDVPGDECRASETESSDPDDDGSDLLDFVVDDDEDEEAEVENEKDEDDGEQEEIKIVENEEDLLIEEDANEDDEEEEVVVDEEVVDEDEEMEVVEEVDSIEEKEQSEDEEESVEKVHKSLDTSKKGTNKLRKSADSSLTQMTENNNGKKRRLKTDMSLTEKDEKECNLSTVSLSTSLKGKKSKQKRVSTECTADAKQLLNDSSIIFNKKTDKLFKSMECSTPKTNSSKREKFNISQRTPDVALEASCKNLSREIRDGKEYTYTDKEVQDKAQKIEKKSKKLRKLKDKENLMHRSLPSELTELVEKTNVSRVMSSKVTDLNKTTPIPSSESPTVMHLRKERLNDSAPELKLSSKSRRKSINSSAKNESRNSLKEIEGDNAAAEEQAEEATTEVNDSLKKKLLKVADNILESDRQKKRKKRKQVAVEQNSVQFSEINFEENIDSRITKKKQHRDDSTAAVVENEEKEETSVDKKKKKKKKVVSMEVDEPVVKDSSENWIETDLENNNEPIPNDEKKKKKKGKKIKDGIESQVPTKKKTKNEKKVAVPYEEVSVTKVSKKRQKLSEDVARKREQASIEKVPKKKQKLSKDAATEQEEASDKKLRKKKQKLLSNDANPQVERSSPKKLSKKKDKLSSENVSKDKAKFVMAAIKSQVSGDVASDSDEGPEVVAFSKARDEALGMIKRAADGIKANKEIKKKKQREHLERMHAEKEMKIQKLESKGQMKKSKVVEVEKRSVKRLPDEVLENLSDIPPKPLKKRKLCQFDDEVLPSRSMFNFMDKETTEIQVEDDILSLPSSAGGTTQFDVVNLQKLKKKKKAAVISFRQKMLARNSRHPVSAYLMYLEKQKASGKDKFCIKP